MKILKQLCSIHILSWEENTIVDFLFHFANSCSSFWKEIPKLFYSYGFENNLFIVFRNLQKKDVKMLMKF